MCVSKELPKAYKLGVLSLALLKSLEMVFRCGFFRAIKSTFLALLINGFKKSTSGAAVKYL